MPPVNVAFDTGPLHGPKTGIGFAVEALRAALTARDDVMVHDYVLSFRAELQPGTRRLPLPASWAHRSWAAVGAPRVDRWLRGAGLVHGTNYVVPPSRLPTVVSVYDVWFLRNPSLAGRDVRRAGEVLRRAVREGAVVHTSSRSTEAAVREIFPGTAVQTVHLGPLPAPQPSAHPPVAGLAGVPFILSVGTLERRKNLPALVRAFGLLAKELPELKLVLAGGDGDDREAIRDAIDSLGPGVAHRVLLTGRVEEGARGWLQAHASVLAYPSLDEGFGFPLLDAMRAGLPVVAGAAGSIPEVAGDAATLVPPDDVEALAAALRDAITDTGTRERLVSAGEAQWRRFSWERCADEMVQLYRRTVDGDVEGLR